MSEGCSACAGTEDQDSTQRGWHSCGLYVGCDDDCRALKNPETPDEKDAALEHWTNHGYLSGCSHGS